METDKLVREHVLQVLRGGNAHMTFEQAVADFPMDHINDIFPNGTYTPWHLLEHLRITQWDILDFIRNPNYQEMEWPKDYWPAPGTQATEADWQRSLSQFEDDMGQLQRIASDPQTDLYVRIPHGTGQTILRELLLVADHNAYHIGEFAIMRQVMDTWGAAPH
jgi:hypothetical protein